MMTSINLKGSRTQPWSIGQRRQPARVELPFVFPLLVVLAILLAETPVAGEGFRNPPPGSFNLGRAGGRIAQIDDSSAVQQNPANLVDIEKPELQLTPSVVYMHAEFQSAGGQSAETIHPWKLLPNFFASAPLLDGQAAVGLGLTVPYGLSVEWDQNSSAFARPTGVLRYQAPYFAELQTLNANPSFAYKICDFLQVGAGFDAMWSQVTLKQFYPWLIFPGSAGTEPDGIANAHGTGWAFGGNVGLTFNITDRQRIAVTYRSPLTVHYSGDFEINHITPTAAALGATGRTDFSTKVDFPTIVAVGYGIQVSDCVRIEANGEWVQFSRFQSLDLSVGRNAFLFPSGTKFVQDWNDTFTAGIGADWKISPNWTLRGGYQYYETPVPDSTFSPTIPDANQNVLTVGVEYKYKHHAFEAAYGLDFYEDRNITTDQNPAFNGKYTFNVHLLSFAYRYSF